MFKAGNVYRHLSSYVTYKMHILNVAYRNDLFTQMDIALHQLTNNRFMEFTKVKIQTADFADWKQEDEQK